MFATGPQFVPRPTPQNVPWRNAGWEVQPVQPPHPRRERFGAVIVDEDGNESPFIPPVVVRLIETPPTIFPQRPKRWLPEVDPRPTRPAPWLAFTEVQPPPPPRYPKTSQRGTAASGSSEFAAFELQAFTEVQSWQPRPIRRVQGMLGAEVPFPQTTLPPVVTFYEQSIPALRARPRVLSTAVVSPEQPLVNFVAHGWPVQHVQPPHRRPERGAGAIARGDDGTQFPRLAWFNAGWDVQPPQPPHPRREKFGAIVPKEDGNEAIFTFIAVPIVWGFEPSMPLPGRRRKILAISDDVVAARFATFQPFALDQPAPLARRRTVLFPTVEDVAAPRVATFPPLGLDPASITVRRALARGGAIAPAPGFPEAPAAAPVFGWESLPLALMRYRRPALARETSFFDSPLVPPPPIPSVWGWPFDPVAYPRSRSHRGALLLWGWPEVLLPPPPPRRPDLAFVADAALWSATSRVSPAYANDVEESASGVQNMGTYEIQTALEIIGNFADSLTGEAADPTTITLFLRDPTGVVQTLAYPGDLTREQVGSYNYVFTPLIHGTWTYKWQGTGAVVATSPDSTITVRQSALISG